MFRIALAIAIVMTTLPAAAQDADHSAHATHGQMTAGQMEGAQMEDGQASQSPATAAYQAAADRMHADMAIDYSGNPDVDFVRGMIPHHEAAVAMARIELDHGTDPEIRKLAEAVIAAQEAEIAFMKDWLTKNGN